MRVAAIGLAALAPVLLVCAYVGARGSEVPYWDQWEITADVAMKAADGSLSFGDLVRQHNEHRLAFSNAVTAVAVWLGGWSLRAEMAASIALALLTSLILLAVLRRDDPDAVGFVVVPFAALFFTLRADFNWVMSQQTGIQFVVLFAVGALAVLRIATPRYAWLLVAALLAACATYSQGSGVLVWPVVVGALPLLGYRRPSFFALWTVVAAVVLVGFVDEYRPGRVVELSARSLSFALRFLGNPFVPYAPGAGVEARTAALLGFGLFAANVLALRSRGRPWRRLAVWLAIAAWAVAMAVVAAAYRTSLGLREALHPRYVTQASMFWLAALAVGGQVVAEARRATHRNARWRALAFANAVLVVLVVGSQGYAAVRAWHAGIVTDVQYACVRCYPVWRDPSCLVGLHPALGPTATDPELRARILERIDGLATRGLAVFKKPEPRCEAARPTPSAAWIDTVPSVRTGRSTAAPTLGSRV